MIALGEGCAQSPLLGLVNFVLRIRCDIEAA